MRTNKLQEYVLANMVAGIAAQEARRLQVDRDDLQQEMTLWVLSHPRKLSQWFGDGLDFQGEGQTAVALRNCARDYANDQRRQAGLGGDDD